MSRILVRLVAYGGLVLAAALLAYAFAVEQNRVLDGAPGVSKSRLIALLGGFVAVAVALGVLCAWDLTRVLGDRAVRFILFGGREVKAVPEIEEAERMRKREPLGAIRILREYLQREPHEWHAMARIAEIYEHDLRNPLAAALEYEELLKHKLEPERWGWSAIHLSNLYLRLRDPDKAEALLRRVVREHGKTSAALKARKRLAGLDR
jgi:signal transduction histidine kinase